MLRWAVIFLLVAAGTVSAQEPVAPSVIDPAWQAAAEKRYAELALEAAERKAYFSQESQALKLKKAQMQVHEDALHRERKHAMELREREAALKHTPAAAPAASCSTCPAKDGCCALLLALAAFVHVLLAIWVYQDIRRRNARGGVWILIVLVTGLIGAFVFALVRIGDPRASS